MIEKLVCLGYAASNNNHRKTTFTRNSNLPQPHEAHLRRLADALNGDVVGHLNVSVGEENTKEIWLSILLYLWEQENTSEIWSGTLLYLWEQENTSEMWSDILLYLWEQENTSEM